MKNLILFILFSTTFICIACSKNKQSDVTITDQNPKSGQNAKADTAKKISEKRLTKEYTIEVVKTLPHDTKAFTQGLFFHNGFLYESTGQYMVSSLRKIDPKSGDVIKKEPIPDNYFGEGSTIIENKIYMLTWTSGTCFVFNADNFKKEKEFKYQGEGWGLTYDGDYLIMSDGTNMLRYLKPEDFQIVKSLTVIDDGTPVASLNELEFIDNEIWANVWMKDKIARISTETGKVASWIDISSLRKYLKPNDKVDVLNGIAYDKESKTIYLTGKDWPYIFVVKTIEKN